MNPKISIVTITYNSEETLERTIKSVIDQHYDNLEYIIVDGGSTDSTLKIINKYSYIINKWVSEPDHGISDAFNKGIGMATGEIIGIINSDDGYMPGALQAIADVYLPEIDVYRGNILFWNTKTGAKIVEVPSMHFSYTGRKLNISHQGTFVAKHTYKKYGVFNVDYKSAMDRDLLMRFERAGASFKYVDKTLAYFTMNGQTFHNYTVQKGMEEVAIIRSHGAKPWHVAGFIMLKTTKTLIKKIINIDVLLRLKHKNYQNMIMNI